MYNYQLLYDNQTLMKYNLRCFSLFIFSLLAVSSKICRGADYQYEACSPTNCGGGGPNISFPFFLTSQQSYCGYPGFSIKCRNGFPLLQLSENEYVIDDIFYHNRSLHVFNAAALSLSSSSSNCSQGLIRIRNTTLPAGRFNYDLLLFSRCRNATGELLRYEVGCNSSREGIDLAVYGGNGNVGRALRTCEESVVARAELSGDEVVDVAAVLRRAFAMNWTASDCSDCRESGGRCGFNETSFFFRCFCPDRPHSRRCKPSKDLVFISYLF